MVDRTGIDRTDRIGTLELGPTGERHGEGGTGMIERRQARAKA
jgi:hypothetical protein